jgi:phage pi2 protein 07
MQLPQESIVEFKKLFKEEYGEDLDNATAGEYARNLVGFFELLLEVDMRDRQRQERLKESPNGFGIPNKDGYSCWLCRNTNTDWEYWYDKNGMKCPPCQKALDDGVVPESVMHDKDIWLSMDDVKKKLELHHSTIQKMIRTGELKARIIQNNGHNYFWVFLKEENELFFAN